MGDVGIEEELDLKGIKYLGGPGDADHKVELKAGYAMPHDPDVRPLAACMLSIAKALWYPWSSLQFLVYF